MLALDSNPPEGYLRVESADRYRSSDAKPVRSRQLIPRRSTMTMSTSSQRGQRATMPGPPRYTIASASRITAPQPAHRPVAVVISSPNTSNISAGDRVAVKSVHPAPTLPCRRSVPSLCGLDHGPARRARSPPSRRRRSGHTHRPAAAYRAATPPRRVAPCRSAGRYPCHPSGCSRVSVTETSTSS